MKYMISSREKHNNHPIHVVHMDLESFILFNDECSTSSEILMEEKTKNLEFSNFVLEIANAENCEKMPSGLKPSASAQKRDEIVKDTKNFGTTNLSQATSKFQSSNLRHPDEESGLWTMDFDGALGKEGACIGV